MRKRFDRKVLISVDDFCGALAKWLVMQSPYVAPENLFECICKFQARLGELGVFSKDGFVEIELSSLTKKVNIILESIPEIATLNIPKSGHDKHIFVDRYSGPINPDDDFIDIMAVAQNITCEFAERADAQCWLDSQKDGA